MNKSVTNEQKERIIWTLHEFHILAKLVFGRQSVHLA